MRLSFIPLLGLYTLGAIDFASSLSPATSGRATLTHYDLPYKYIASCGCVGLSTRHPTAAINSLIYGSNNSYGPSCGVCYRLRLDSTPLTPPPPDGTGIQFAADDVQAPSIVVKITDDCPLGGDWCTQTLQKPSNSLGSMLHFDLAWPSRAISNDFFPTDQGRDYGIWWAQYEIVDCIEWSGFNDQEAGGSDWAQQNSACCPLRPNLNLTTTTIIIKPNQQQQEQHCPSYSDQVALGLSNEEIYAQVPNTSNILSKDDDDQANSAWSHLQTGFFWSWSGTRRNNAVESRMILQDWQAIGVPPLLRRIQAAKESGME